jgi:hypothetical protein
MSPKNLSPRERLLGAVVLLLVLVACLAPPLAQVESYHAFADTHTRWGLPHAFNLLSNLPFALVGVALFARLYTMPRAALGGAQRVLVQLAAAGLVLTALGSSWYHLAPDDAGLVVDRAAMCVAFAALLGLAACRISERAGLALAAVVLVGGLAAVQAWSLTGKLTPWVVVQGGGVLLLAALAAQRHDTALPVRWWLVIAGYALAKLLELGDHALWVATDAAVSGHSLKHVVAAASALPLLTALIALGHSSTQGQNAPQPPARGA